MLGSSSLHQTIKSMSPVPTLKTRVLPGFLLQANFCPISFDLYKGFFMEKKRPKLEKYIQIARFFRISVRSSQERRRILYIVSTFIYLECSQMWLNYFLDDHHYKFDYITKSLKETLVGHSSPQSSKKGSSLESFPKNNKGNKSTNMTHWWHHCSQMNKLSSPSTIGGAKHQTP